MSDSSGVDAPFERGHVVWHDGLFRGSGRPWLVVSDDRHPFHGEEYLVVGLTTTDRPGAIHLGESAWTVGGLPRTTYASPWFVTTVKHPDIDRGVGHLSPRAVDEIVSDVSGYVE